MVEKEAVIKEFEAARDKYIELAGRLIKLKVPGVIDPIGIKCDAGVICGGGEALRPPLEKLKQPLPK